MGKYTSLARTLRRESEATQPGEDKGSSQKNTYVNINNNDNTIGSNPPAESSGSVTTLRPTTLTTLILDEKDETDEKASVVCIHNVEPEECAVCSGYVRWLIEDDTRFAQAKANPEAMRQRYREIADAAATPSRQSEATNTAHEETF
jgi:hypothetical protein